MSNDIALSLNARVIIPKSGAGTIAFLGTTDFAAGKWVGILLDEPLGKNDGCVNGTRYFAAQDNYGVFVRPSQVKLLNESEEMPPPALPSKVVNKSPAKTTRPTLASSISRSSSTTTKSANAVSTPSSRLQSPMPIKGTLTRPAIASRTPTSTSMARTPSNQSTTSQAARPSSTALRRTTSNTSQTSSVMGPPPSRRTSVIPAASRRGSASSTASGLMRPSSVTSNANKLLFSPRIDEPMSPFEEHYDMSQSPQIPSTPPIQEDPFSLKGASPKKPLYEQSVPLREHEEALLRIKSYEARLLDQRDRLKELDRLKEEADSWNLAKPKLQSKLIEVTNELKNVRKQLKGLEAERDSLNTKYNDLMDSVEMATLDKEVAEEQKEMAEAALESTQEKLADLEIELGVLREENQKFSRNDAESTGEEQNSLAFIQLRKQNERLKEALARLRDLTAENDTEHRRKLQDMEKELELTSDLQTEFDQAFNRAEAAEAQVENLKLQLDDAMGAEDMLEQLTDRNLTLTEKLEELRASVEDLEALKDLNDELEENHVETAKQLLEEIDVKDRNLLETQKRAELLEEGMLDYEATIGQFRELVTSLQSDVATMREQQNVSATEKQNLNSQTQAMMSLNMKLQSTVSRTQVKTIDLEIRKLEASQAVQRLSIIRPYLPSPFFEADSDAVDALLFFERLAQKSELIATTIAQKHNIQDSLTSVVPDGMVNICETRGKVARFSILTRRFAANLRRCSPEIFLKMGSVYKELNSIDKKVDHFIELVRREEFVEVECGREVDKFIAQAAHLAEVNLGESGLDLGELQQGQALTIDYDLDTFLAGVGYTKQLLAIMSKDTDIETLPSREDLTGDMFEPLQQLIDQARIAQISARKLHRRIEDLTKDSMALLPDSVEALSDLSRTIHLLAIAAVRMSDLISRYCSEVRSTGQSLQVSTLLGIVQEATSELSFRSASNVMVALDTEIALAVSRVSACLNAASNPDVSIKVAYIAPWLERVAEIEANAVVNQEAERRVLKMTEEMRDLARDVRAKDQALQETLVKVELLERRLDSTRKQAEALSELDVELQKMKKQEKAKEETIEALHEDLDSLEQENLKLRQAPAVSSETTNGSALQASTTSTVENEVLAFTGSLETAQLLSHINSLRSTLEYLRKENSFLRSHDMLHGLQSLAALPPPAYQDSTIRPIAEQRKALWKEALELTSQPKVVDISHVPGTKKTWQRMEKKPEMQLERQRAKMKSLATKIQNLGQSAEGLPFIVNLNL